MVSIDNLKFLKISQQTVISDKSAWIFFNILPLNLVPRIHHYLQVWLRRPEGTKGLVMNKSNHYVMLIDPRCSKTSRLLVVFYNLSIMMILHANVRLLIGCTHYRKKIILKCIYEKSCSTGIV